MDDVLFLLGKVAKRIGSLEVERDALRAENAKLQGALMTIRQHYTTEPSAFAGQIARLALSGEDG